MPKCGVCGDNYGDLITKHAYTCEDDSKAGAMPYNYCDSCGVGLEYKNWHYRGKGQAFLCHKCVEEESK